MNEKEPKTAVDARFGQAVTTIMDKFGVKEKSFSKDNFGSEQTVSKIRTGYQSATSEYIDTLVNKFNVSANWLFTGEGEMFFEAGNSFPAIAHNGSEESNIIMVPFGEEDHLTLEEAKGNTTFKRGYIPFLGKGTWIIFQVPTDAMAPLMTYGDSICTRAVTEDRDLESGEVYLFNTKFKRDLKRIRYKKGSTTITLIPDNSEVYEPEEIDLNEISWPIYKVDGILTSRTSPINPYQRRIDNMVSDMVYVAKKSVEGLSTGIETINRVANLVST